MPRDSSSRASSSPDPESRETQAHTPPPGTAEAGAPIVADVSGPRPMPSVASSLVRLVRRPLVRAARLVARLMPARRAGKSLRRPFKRVLRYAGAAVRLVGHVGHYRVPGEQQQCPACLGREVRHLEPLSLLRKSPRFGFISGCERCGVLFANPLPTAEALAEVYSPEGDWGRHRQEEREKQVSVRRLEELFGPIRQQLDVLHPPAGASVLDVGCGLGGMLDSLSDAGWSTFGIDPATKVAFARHQEVAAIPDSPTFDLAILHHVLEHITEPLDLLRQLARAIKPGGYLLISQPNLDDVAEHGELKYCIRSTVHILAYSASCSAWLAAEAGFRVISSAAVGAPGSRRRATLVVRDEGPIARPERPLDGARAALRRYYAAHPAAEAPLRGAPARLRAAYRDLERAGWRADALNKL